MEKVLRIGLPILIIVLGYLVYESIAGPMREQKKVEALEARIVSRLQNIRTAQFAYRDKNNQFASSFDELIRALKEDKIAVIKKEGDEEDTLSVVTTDTMFVLLQDYAFPAQKANLDSIMFVPGNPNGAKFRMSADIITVNGVKVPVFLAEDPEPYNKKRALRVGSLSDPVYTGNWE